MRQIQLSFIVPLLAASHDLFVPRYEMLQVTEYQLCCEQHLQYSSTSSGSPLKFHFADLNWVTVFKLDYQHQQAGGSSSLQTLINSLVGSHQKMGTLDFGVGKLCSK